MKKSLSVIGYFFSQVRGIDETTSNLVTCLILKRGWDWRTYYRLVQAEVSFLRRARLADIEVLTQPWQLVSTTA